MGKASVTAAAGGIGAAVEETAEEVRSEGQSWGPASPAEGTEGH